MMSIRTYQRGDLKIFQKHLGEAKGKMALETANLLTSEVRDSIAGWTSTSRYNLSRGRLAESFKPTLQHRGKQVVSYGTLSKSRYAHIQDQGGTIRPVRRKFLTIPLTAEARSKSALDYGDTLFGPAKIFGTLLLFKRVGRSNDVIRPQYILRTSVTIKAKGYLETALRRATPKIKNITHGFIRKAISKSASAKGLVKRVRGA